MPNFTKEAIHVELFLGRVWMCLSILLSFWASIWIVHSIIRKTKHAASSSPLPHVHLQTRHLPVESLWIASATTCSGQHGFSLMAQKERDSASEKVEELQRQLNELWKDNETLRKAHTLDLQKKVCYWYAMDVCTLWWLHGHVTWCSV